MTTRAEFLSRVRAEMRKTSGLFPATVAERSAPASAEAEKIRRGIGGRWAETVERFRLEFEGVGGIFHGVSTAGDVPEVVGRIAREREARRLIAWHPSALGADWRSPLTVQGLTVHTMPEEEVANAVERQGLRAIIATADIGLTGVDLAVAETGTLILVSGGGRPRSTSLLPPYHVAVFDRTALVESLAQVGVMLEAWHETPAPPGRGASINWITGPSRTADIELTLTRGVHGPKEIHAIFVEALIRG